MTTRPEAGNEEMDGLLSLDKAAAILDISERNLKYRIASREIPSVKLGGRRLIRKSDLRQYIAKLTDE